MSAIGRAIHDRALDQVGEQKDGACSPSEWRRLLRKEMQHELDNLGRLAHIRLSFVENEIPALGRAKMHFGCTITAHEGKRSYVIAFENRMDPMGAFSDALYSAALFLAERVSNDWSEAQAALLILQNKSREA